MDVILSGVVGSTAYGMNGPSSDIDRLGFYAAPTTAFHGLTPPVDKRGSVVTTNPDSTYHEALKATRLVLAGNPTVTEALFLVEYDTLTYLGAEMVDIRSAFLSATRVRDAYLGYAFQQFNELERRGGTFGPDLAKRTSKHARHLSRLITQGFDLWSTGTMTVRLDNPQEHIDFGNRVAAGAIDEAREKLASAEARFDATPSVLPDNPDLDTVETWLLRVRAHYLGAAA